MSLEDKLAQAITDQAKSKDMFDALVSDLKQEITESKKPKLRHGRCGYMSVTGAPYITIGNGVEAVVYFEDGSSKPVGEFQDGLSSSEGVTAFEAFDDLTVLQEDVTKFEVDGLDIRIDSDGDLSLDGEVYIKPDKIGEFILKLRQMEMTLKRKEAKL